MFHQCCPYWMKDRAVLYNFERGPSQPSMVLTLHNYFRGEDINMKSLWCSMNGGQTGVPSTVKCSHGL